MSKYTTEALRSVALVGHGAAGKTSLAEALLFATNAIAAKGIDKARLAAEGFGLEKPIADNNTEEGKAKNRRVEMVKVE